MARRRGRKSHLEDLLPEDRRDWTREIWADREDVARLPYGAWMLREAARVLGLSEDVVDAVLRQI
jgi:hypothetical protein